MNFKKERIWWQVNKEPNCSPTNRNNPTTVEMVVGTTLHYLDADKVLQFAAPMNYLSCLFELFIKPKMHSEPKLFDSPLSEH